VSAHQHEVASEGRDYCYSGRVTDAAAAAGNIERQQTCACGAVRWVAINGRHHAATPWTAVGFAVVAKADYGRSHTIESLHATAADAWAVIDGDGSFARDRCYVAQTSRQVGDTLPQDEMRIVPRPEVQP
jgi:hypothetical protein